MNEEDSHFAYNRLIVHQVKSNQHAVKSDSLYWPHTQSNLPQNYWALNYSTSNS